LQLGVMRKIGRPHFGTSLMGPKCLGSGKMQIYGPVDLIMCRMWMVTVDFSCRSNR